jgi:uncharacterized membrane protein YkvA (DUF1232 family)
VLLGKLFQRFDLTPRMGRIATLKKGPFMKKKAPLTLERATMRAVPYVRHKKKLLWLLEKATLKSQQSYEFLLAPWECLQIFLRLLRAHLAGKFRVPLDSLLMVVAAVIYFVSPFDLIPDSIPVLGLIDDTAVIACVARANLTLIGSFRKWEILHGRGFPSALRSESFKPTPIQKEFEKRCREVFDRERDGGSRTDRAAQSRPAKLIVELCNKILTGGA